MYKTRFFINAVIISIIIIFLDFFSLTLLNDNPAIKFRAIFGIGILLAIYSITHIVLKGIIKKPMDGIILLLILSLFFSMVTANYYWDQPFSSSIKAYSYFYIYFLYFLLVSLKISYKEIEKIIKILFFISLVVFAINFITFPNPLFAYRHEERRGGMTIFFYGQGFTFLGAFYFLNRFLKEFRLLHLGWFVLSFICLFLLTQSRMNLLSLVAGAILLFLMNDLRRKYLYIIILLFIGAITNISSNIFSGIKEESQIQAESYQEDVRVLAHNFYLKELQGGIPTILVGNGVPDKKNKLSSKYDRGKSMGYYTSDVGLTGILSYFGLFGTMVWLSIFYTVFKERKLQNFNYLKTYFLVLATTALTGWSIFDPGYMPATILALYLVRCQHASNSIIYKNIALMN